MRAAWMMLGLWACSGQPTTPPAKPEPPTHPEPPPPPPPPEPPADPINKNADISAMAEPERHDFLMKLGEKVYKTGDGGLACLTCHGEQGAGMPGAFPPLVGQKDFMGDCKNHASLVIKGLSGEITVNGTKYNGVMVPQGDALNDLQIAAVISYERNSWGNDYGYCSPDDVKAARAQ